MALLKKLQSEYDLPLTLCSDIVKNLRSSYKQEMDDQAVFVEELPHNLRQQICIHMYKDIYKNVDFLSKKQTTFLSWICPHLRPKVTLKGEYVFVEGDDVKCIYFNNSEQDLSYCLRKFQNVEYIGIKKGLMFGMSDIYGSMILVFDQNKELQPDFQSWYEYQSKLRHQSTVICNETHEMVILTLSDLNRMKYEYTDYFNEIFKNALFRLQKHNTIKEESIKKCSQQQLKWLGKTTSQ